MKSKKSCIPTDIEKILDDIFMEYYEACQKHSNFHSTHEGYAVIKEELDELWDEVKLKRELRSNDKMYHEAVQVAAMSLRFITDILIWKT